LNFDELLYMVWARPNSALIFSEFKIIAQNSLLESICWHRFPRHVIDVNRWLRRWKVTSHSISFSDLKHGVCFLAVGAKMLSQQLKARQWRRLVVSDILLPQIIWLWLWL